MSSVPLAGSGDDWSHRYAPLAALAWLALASSSVMHMAAPRSVGRIRRRVRETSGVSCTPATLPRQNDSSTQPTAQAVPSARRCGAPVDSSPARRSVRDELQLAPAVARLEVLAAGREHLPGAD